MLNNIVELLSLIPRVQSSPSGVTLLSNNSKLVEVTEQKLLLVGNDLTNKLLAKVDTLNKELSLEDFKNFIVATENSFLRLNHAGISYACSNFAMEVDFYNRIIKNTGFSLYEEPSDDVHAQWLFVGNPQNWGDPLFEIVLTKTKPGEEENIWRPHFQIDIDTKLKPEELEIILTKYFGKDFICWKLDIPNYGVVLDMGMLGSVNGTKIYLGVGTNLRNTKYHREEILKKL